MRVDFRPPCLLSVFLLGGPLFVGAQDTPETNEALLADRTQEELSDAERLLRLRQVVTLDEDKLERLRSDLSERQAFLDLLTGQMAQFQDTWEEMKARLDELEPASEEATALQADITRLEQRYERYNRHSSLTFQAERALREQIRALEQKIQTDRQALAIFRGTRQSEPVESSVGSGVSAPAVSPPVLPPIPGMPMAAPHAAPVRQQVAILPETAEQIEARQVLDRKTHEARKAERAVVTFVQRKEALEQQIELERTLLRVDEDALTNLEGFTQELREWLEQQPEAGVGRRQLADQRDQIGRLDAEIVRVREQGARRRIDVASLEERLEYAIGERDRVEAFADGMRDEAEAARKWLLWLESPLYPGNLVRWAVERGPRVLAVLLLAGLLVLILRFSLKRIARLLVTRSRKAKSAVNRADTLALSFESLATTLILAACTLLMLEEAGIDVQTVLGGAAILGVAIAFGAQNLMRDYFTGFMMLLEDQYELGDLITIGKITGTVERVNMRVTMLRDLEGRVHFIPNGQIGSLTNRTYDWARALVEIPVGPEQDVDRVMALLLEVARELNADPEWSKDIVDEPQMLGVDAFTESGVVIKLMLKTEPDRMFPVRRELLRRVKNAFDKAGIQPGVPQRAVRQNAPHS